MNQDFPEQLAPFLARASVRAKLRYRMKKAAREFFNCHIRTSKDRSYYSQEQRDRMRMWGRIEARLRAGALIPPKLASSGYYCYFTTPLCKDRGKDIAWRSYRNKPAREQVVAGLDVCKLRHLREYLFWREMLRLSYVR